MDTAQLITLYFERSTALQNYWTLFVVVIGGLLAFSSLRQRPNRLTTILITVLFCCFAYKNCGAIGDVTHQRMAILQTLRSRGSAAQQDVSRTALEHLNLAARTSTLTDAQRAELQQQLDAVAAAERARFGNQAQTSAIDALLPTLDVPDWTSVRRFHVFSDVLTVLTLWSMEWRRRKHERERVETDHR